MKWPFLLIGTLALAACGQWKGDGTDEALPDVIGLTTGLPRAFGVPSETLHDQAEEDIRKNRAPEEEATESSAESAHRARPPSEPKSR